MEPLFTTYKEYEQYVTEEWNAGAINELEEAGYIVFEKVDEYGNVSLRQLTEHEFNEKLKQDQE